MSGSSAVQLLLVPYDSGRFDERMGAGPRALMAAGAARTLRERGHTVTEKELEPESDWRSELRTAFELHRILSRETSDARRSGVLPVVLAGNCNASVGVLAGLTGSGRRVGLVWMDAHGDFNTPDQDGAGFLDGQGLAMAVGRCWQAATSRIPGFRPLAEQDVLLIGARDLTDDQRTELIDSELTLCGRDAVAVEDALRSLAGRADVVHLHIDLDVYDPSVGRANEYAAPGGLLADEVLDIVTLATGILPIGSATIASYDPSFDPDGAISSAAVQLLGVIADGAQSG
ncbi:arginase family protein [Microbacterium sp. NPDC058345]|uniref:arginase family protein n=1 Tax=Microbacterium sp. NPDC058345 TaxID=3346455 RepID=UPI00365766E4